MIVAISKQISLLLALLPFACALHLPSHTPLNSEADVAEPRVLCVVMMTPKDPLFDVNRRWLESQCDGVRFFLSDAGDGLETDDHRIVRLAMNGEEESHANIWAKSWRMWLWLAEHEACRTQSFSKGWDYILKSDMDTLLLPANFKRMLQHEKSTAGAEFIGHRIGTNPDYAPVGGAYALKCDALSRARPVLVTLRPGADRTIVDRSGYFRASHCSNEITTAEEVKMAHCLGIADIALTGAEDSHGREYIQPFQLCAHTDHMPSPTPEKAEHDWFWMGKMLNISLADCCAAHPVAFHSYKDVTFLQRVHKTFAGRTDGVTLKELKALHECGIPG
eukprot:gnl/TRDRNA2_/TRDRNA2_35834_c0_seq1.p1 gnl/TRDRNA2_/TRDRNA2_35834_c0~~gnl/TRDRNA2_/TRDRNA2_35834_c0_seq1.p1  ORF type:complete len:334 (+),score=40.78 gnl/TRDRNA2_/TRDRNA2_35834_c0_seq1:36-1037(+)